MNVRNGTFKSRSSRISGFYLYATTVLDFISVYLAAFLVEFQRGLTGVSTGPRVYATRGIYRRSTCRYETPGEISLPYNNSTSNGVSRRVLRLLFDNPFPKARFPPSFFIPRHLCHFCASRSRVYIHLRTTTSHTKRMLMRVSSKTHWRNGTINPFRSYDYSFSRYIGIFWEILQILLQRYHLISSEKHENTLSSWNDNKTSQFYSPSP